MKFMRSTHLLGNENEVLQQEKEDWLNFTGLKLDRHLASFIAVIMQQLGHPLHASFGLHGRRLPFTA